MTVKLLDKETKSLVDFEPNAVNAAVDSGKFLFPKNRGVPVRADGQLKYISAADAAKYRDRLLFVNDEDVERGQAEERFGGLGGAAQALAYGGVKGLTLGTVPALASALSPEFAEYSKQIELGRPGVTAAGEIASLAVDPFAVAGKALGLGRVAQEVRAGSAAAEAAATRAAPAFAEATYEVERAVPALAAGPAAEAAPLRLGGRVAAAEPEAGAGFAARDAGRQPRALPPAGREPIAAPESPLTYQAPPFESQVMTDLRLGRANTADRIAELDQTIQLTLGSRARGARQAVRGLQEERAGLARQIEEYDFQLAKYEAPEADALAAQAERAAGAGEMREPTTLLTGEVSPAAAEIKLGERAAAEAEQARERLRMGGGAPEYVGPEPGPLALAGERPLAPTAAREGVLEAEFAELPDAGPRLTPEPAAPIAAAPVPQGGGLTLPPGLASMSAQGGLYGASEEARRQATGESQGGMGAILGAGALGAAIPAGLMLGGKVAAKGAQALATGAREAGLIERIAAGASTIEKQHIARSFDLSRDQVTRLNNKFAIPEIEQQGTDAFVRFIKGELDDVSKLKAAFPDDAFLQSIPENTSLKFGQLTPDRKKAFADAVERFYGKEYDTIFTDAVRAAPVDRSIIDRIIADTEARAVAGAPQRGLESVAPEIAAMRDYQGQHSVGTLRELQSRIGEIFRGRQGEGGKFTEAQAAMYGGLKRALADAVEAAEPGAAARLAENDVRYEMSKIMAEGANKVLSKATTTSPIGRDLLSQFALGFAAVGHPLAATKFFVTTVGLRHLYNTRGEGIIADMAGKLSTSLRKNPTAAATEAADIIVNARRPMLLGMSATKLTDAKPEDYTSMSRAVRELEATRDKAKRQIADATSGLTPEEQQKSVEFFDNQLNALASALPKGIPTGKALNEQEKNYTIFARAILDPQVYGVQAILNGGPGASVAADAINSLGPQGQEFLQKLGDNLQARISESEQLRGREDMLQTLRNVKTATRKSVGGGGGARLRALHPSSDVKNIAKGAPSAFQNAAKAFSGSAKGIQ